MVCGIGYDFGIQDPKLTSHLAVITILLIILTICNAIACMMNFDKGLKPHITKRKVNDDDDKNSMTLEMTHPHAAQPVPSRMTID